jgi:hypothetical protein
VRQARDVFHTAAFVLYYPLFFPLKNNKAAKAALIATKINLISHPHLGNSCHQGDDINLILFTFFGVKSEIVARALFRAIPIVMILCKKVKPNKKRRAIKARPITYLLDT